jgi:CheY-like chemotaxis protein
VVDQLDVLQSRQVERFTAACREQERALALPPASREAGLSVGLRRQVLARQREALVETTHRQLIGSGSGRRPAGTRAVVAHHHPWFVAALTKALEEGGVQVVGVTANGATAVGVAVAEQPDVVIVQDVLEMLRGEEVAAAVREYVPHAAVIVLSQALAPALVASKALGALHDKRAPARTSHTRRRR